MGMSTSVYGIIPADEKFRKMKAIYDLCEEQGIDIPDEVEDFFDGERPDENGVKIYLTRHEAVKEYSNSEYAEEGYNIQLDKLPKDIKIIRVVNSW
jgi:hypothetical protein